MFDAFCPTCDRRQLISPGQVTGLVNAPLGIAVQYRCRCGELGVWTTRRGSASALAQSAG